VISDVHSNSTLSNDDLSRFLPANSRYNPVISA